MKKKTDKYVVPGKKPKKEEPKKKCNCMVCQHSREFHRIVGLLKDPVDRKIMWHFWNTLEDVETGAEVWKAKAYGTWPGWEHNHPKCVIKAGEG